MKKFFAAFVFLVFTLPGDAQNEGNAFFGDAVIHDVYLTFHQSSYWDSLTTGYTNDVYIKCDVVIDTDTMPDCGIKFKGNSSYNNPSNKKSWKIDFNEYVSGQKHDGLKKINLNNCFKDPSFLREKMMLDFLYYRGIYGPRCTYARVYVNGVYWGLYTAVEEIDKTFLDLRFNDKKGNLFKGDPSGDLKWLGSSPTAYYTKYELKTNETQNDWTDLVTFINKLNNTAIGALPDTMANYLDMDNFYYTWASHVLFSNLDSYLGSGHNYYIYHDSTINQFRYISWDVNEAFGNFNQGMTVAQIEAMNIFYVPNPPGNRPLHERLLQNTAAKQRLADALCDLVNYDFSIWTLDAKIDSLANAIRTDVYADSLKFYSNQNFEDNLNNTVTVVGNPGGNDMPGIKSFLTNRRNSVASQLGAYGCTVGISDIQNEMLDLYPNPAHDQIRVDGLNENNCVYEIFDLSGRMILTGNLNNSPVISLHAIASEGMYILQMYTPSGKIYRNKFMKQ